MKNLESRVTKLEMQIPTNDFLVVFAQEGEDHKAAIKRVILENKIKRPSCDFFIIYFNLYSSTRQSYK
jgi:hypothetical protein